jgi:hypothetical protein
MQKQRRRRITGRCRGGGRNKTEAEIATEIEDSGMGRCRIRGINRAKAEA